MARTSWSLRMGEHVEVLPDQLHGVVRYMGPLGSDFNQWVGIELERPVDTGSDGNYRGTQYFHCQDKYGIFALRENVIRLNGADSTPHRIGREHSSSVTAHVLPNATDSNREQGQEEIGRVLQRRMSLRPSPKQVESRGVVPPQYFNDPKRAYDSVGLGHEVASWNLGTFLQRRPSQADLENLGVVPPRYFENPKQNSQRLTLLREVVGHHMEDFLRQRKSIRDLANANILPEEYLDNDIEEARMLQRQKTVDKMERLKKKLDKGRRPSVVQISEMGYIPADYVDVLTDGLQKHSRKESRIQYAKDELNLPDQIAENLIAFMHGGDSDPKKDMIAAQTSNEHTNQTDYESEDALVKKSVAVPEDVTTLDSNPDEYTFTVDPYQGFVPMAPVKRKETQNQLHRRLSSTLRPSFQELESKRILLDNTHEEPNGKSNQKSTVEPPEQGYTSGMDEKSLFQLYGLADEVRQTHAHMESAVQDLQSRLNLPDVVSHAISVELLEELNRLDPTLSENIQQAAPSVNNDKKNDGLSKNNNTANNNINKNHNTTTITTATNGTNNDNKKTNNKTDGKKNAEVDAERYQTLISQLQQAIALEKEKVRDSDRAYTLLQAQYQSNENALSEVRAKEKEYLSRIQKLEHSPDERYKELVKERDTLKSTVEELKARINRQEQYYSKLENANNKQSTTTTTTNNNKDNKSEEYLTKISEIQKQHMALTQERDEYRDKSEKAREAIEQMAQTLKRVEESKIKFIQQTAEQMNQLRYYLKRYNGAPAKQGDL